MHYPGAQQETDDLVKLDHLRRFFIKGQKNAQGTEKPPDTEFLQFASVQQHKYLHLLLLPPLL